MHPTKGPLTSLLFAEISSMGRWWRACWGLGMRLGMGWAGGVSRETGLWKGSYLGPWACAVSPHPTPPHPRPRPVQSERVAHLPPARA